MFTKLRLTDFKSFPEAELRFGPITTIIGANATGKSNLRDALRFLHGVGRGMTLPEIFGGNSSLGWAGIRGGAPGVMRNGSDQFSISVKVGDQYEYRIDIGLANKGPTVVRESLYDDERMLFDSHPTDSPIRQIGKGQLTVRFLSESAKIFELASFQTNQPVLSKIAQPNSATNLDPNLWTVSGIIQTLQALRTIRFLDFTPVALRQPSISGEKTIRESGDNLSSVLRYLVEDQQKGSILTSWLKELTPMDVARIGFEDYPDGKILAVLEESSGRKIPLSSASDGTLRFLGILASVLSPEPPSLLCFEEIETGLHPTRVQLISELLQKETKDGKPQVLLTTHSPNLLGWLGREHRDHAYLAYRLPETADTRLKAFRDIPQLESALLKADASRLFESGWFEDAVFYAEANPSPISFVAEDPPSESKP